VVKGVVDEGGTVGAAWGAVCAAPEGGSGDAGDNCEGWELHDLLGEEGGGVGGGGGAVYKPSPIR